jgi:hypothetical protein
MRMTKIHLPQENGQYQLFQLTFKHFHSSETSTVKFSDTPKEFIAHKRSESFEEVLQVSNFPPDSNQKQIPKPWYETNIIPLPFDKDYLISSRNRLKSKDYSLFSSTTYSDEVFMKIFLIISVLKYFKQN